MAPHIDLRKAANFGKITIPVDSDSSLTINLKDDQGEDYDATGLSFRFDVFKANMKDVVKTYTGTGASHTIIFSKSEAWLKKESSQYTAVFTKIITASGDEIPWGYGKLFTERGAKVSTAETADLTVDEGGNIINLSLSTETVIVSEDLSGPYTVAQYAALVADDPYTVDQFLAL